MVRTCRMGTLCCNIRIETIGRICHSAGICPAEVALARLQCRGVLESAEFNPRLARPRALCKGKSQLFWCAKTALGDGRE